MNWQPISTAPKDGTVILLCDVGYAAPEYLIGRWRHDRWWGKATNSGHSIVWNEATHWTYLTPPLVDEAK